MKIFISILFILFTFTGPITAQEKEFVDTVATDTSVSKIKQLDKTAIEKRIPSETEINRFKDDRAFDYTESERPEDYPEWILKILDWYEKMKYAFFSTMLTKDTLTVAFIVLVVALIIGIILRMQNVSIRNLFSRQKLNQDETEFYEEDVNQMNFEQLIAQAIENKNYRLAVRFLYLKNLKTLSDRLIIDWNPNKTNYSYLDEIKDQLLKGKFQESTLIFDFVWYGEFVLNENSFDAAHQHFNEFNRMINNGR